MTCFFYLLSTKITSSFAPKLTSFINFAGCCAKAVLWHWIACVIFHADLDILGEGCECNLPLKTKFHDLALQYALINSGLAWMTNKQQELAEAPQ